MLFPPQMVRDFLRSRSLEPFYDENGPELYDFFRRLFALMNSGGTLRLCASMNATVLIVEV